jgi:hypothetical protein
MSTPTNTEPLRHKQRRNQRRIQRQEELRRKARAAERRRRGLFALVGGVVLLIVVALVAAFVWTNQGSVGVAAPAGPNDTPRGGIFVPELGRDHIARGQPHPPYNSDPPTSGWHWSDEGAPARAGIHTTPVPDEAQVHNLEHGTIVIQYNNLTDAERDRLIKFISDRYLNSRGPLSNKILVAPRPTLNTKYALTAWTWLDKFDTYDEARIADFIEKRVNKGPEYAPMSP